MSGRLALLVLLLVAVSLTPQAFDHERPTYPARSPACRHCAVRLPEQGNYRLQPEALVAARSTMARTCSSSGRSCPTRWLP
uniref:Secreted protein n=1 Tax=Steinernema glaseri TaxID=37863 RepID=A0A1I8A686_9BILA